MLVELLCLALFLSLSMSLAWAVRMRTGRSGWIDAIWSAAIGLASLAAAFAPAPPSAIKSRAFLAAAMILLWAGRLATHLAARTRGAADDPRYASLAREWGGDFPRRLFAFLQIQAAAGLPLVLAVAAAARSTEPFPSGGDMLGLALAMAALAGESVSDRQLVRFRRFHPEGGVCEIGLWRYSRHPNYFFEFLFWCAWPLMALDPAGVHLPQLVALGAPALIYWLLVHVSGIPLLEKHMLASRGAAFEAYRRRVNAFFPGPRRADRGG